MTQPDNRLAIKLKHTSQHLFGLFSNKQANSEQLIEALYDQLILADLGIKLTERIIGQLEHRSRVDLKTQLTEILLSILQQVEQPLKIEDKPFLILVFGVNGVGKTTTISKLTKYYKDQGMEILLAAMDTFRAAAIEQLCYWGDKNDVRVVAQSSGSNPSAVLFDALDAAHKNNVNIIIADTAGRMHHQDHLLEEMKKIVRTTERFNMHNRIEKMLILDGGTGQNALAQTNYFHKAIGIDGLTVTKLDGTAKGGIIFSLADELKIPVRFIGIGEDIEDLQTFNAKAFTDSLLTEL